MNLYHWNHCQFNRAYGSGDAIGYAPDLEAAIQNILAECREYYSYLKNDWGDPEDPESYFYEEMAAIESELRSTEPIINPRAILIKGSD